MLVVPGGGPTDLTIERLNERYNFNPDTHHRACAKAQDQTGLMLEGLSSSEKSVACEDLNAVLESLSNKKLPILMPSRIIFDIEPFERTWVITSDSMAAWFAWLVHCNRIIVLKSVDGIYSDFDHIANKGKNLVSKISPNELINFNTSALDDCFGPFIAKFGIEAYVINAENIYEIDNIINGNSFRGTKICKS